MSGALKNKLILLRRTQTADLGGGASAPTLSADKAVWASVERLTTAQDFLGPRGDGGRRRLKRIAATTRAAHAAQLELAPGDLLAFEACVFEIMSIASADTRERRVTLVCEEVAGAEAALS
ncbi:MAG: hypothetical protein AAFY22_11425 [Pseudomonadota bacterium]